MKLFSTATLVLAFSFALFSCTATKNSSGSLEKSGKKNPTTSNSAYNPSQTRYFDLLHTKLEIQFLREKQQLKGIATLTLKPYFYPQNQLVLDAKGMEIYEIEWLASENNHTYTYKNNKITVSFPKPLTQTDTLTLRIKYLAKPNEIKTKGSAAITEDKGLYFIDPLDTIPSKPFQIWTQGETEASSCWFPTIDSPNEKTTQEMYITVPKNLTVLSNGEFIFSTENADDTKTDYWKMDLPHAPYLFMMAIGEFAVVKDTWRDIEVNYYVEPTYEKFAKNIFGNTPEMLEFFSTKLGVDYAWNKYSQVVVRDFVSGAMENTTATVFMENLQMDDRELLDDNWDGIIAHELFHHWFGDLVTCESWANLPLNESFANYSEYLWKEYKYGLNEADYLDFTETEEYFDEATKKIEPLIRYRYADKEEMFDRHSYNKGGRILHMLRKQVGDEAFFKSLNLYLTRKKFQTAEVHDLRLCFEEVTGEDLNWFFDQWFLSPGHPELKVTHKYKDGQLELFVQQTQDKNIQPTYKLPLKVTIWNDFKPTTHTITISKTKETFYLPCATNPQTVILDSDFQLLGKINHAKTKAELVFQYKNCNRFKGRLLALKELFAPQSSGKDASPFIDSTITQTLYSALSDSFWVIRNYALQQFSSFFIPNTPKNITQISKMALRDPHPAVRSRALYLILSYDANQFVPIFERGLEENAYSIVSASLRGYLKATSTNKSEILERFIESKNGDIIFTLGDYFIYTKDLTKFDWFNNKIEILADNNLYHFIGFYGEYANLLTASEKEKAKKTLLSISKNNQREWIRKMAKDYYDKIQ